MTRGATEELLILTRERAKESKRANLSDLLVTEPFERQLNKDNAHGTHLNARSPKRRISSFVCSIWYCTRFEHCDKNFNSRLTNVPSALATKNLINQMWQRANNKYNTYNKCFSYTRAWNLVACEKIVEYSKIFSSWYHLCWGWLSILAFCTHLQIDIWT